MPKVLSLAELAHHAATRWPKRAFAAFPDATCLYEDVWRDSCGVAKHLAKLGVQHGAHVGVLIPNTPQAVAAIIGIVIAGATPVPLNTRYRADELPFAIAHADLVGLVTMPPIRTAAGDAIDYLERLREALPDLTDQRAGALALAAAPRLRFIATLSDSDHGFATPCTQEATEDLETRLPGSVDPDAPALILYTSGTTARPKAAVISHRALIETCTLGAVDGLGLASGEAIWNPAPLCHISAFVSLVGALAVGATYVTAPHFDAEQALDALVRHKVAIAYANFPPFYFGVDAVRRRHPTPLPALRVVTTAASPPEVERIRDMFPEALQLSVTGATELCGTICINDPADTPRQRAETAGRPIPGVDISIRNPERGAPQEPGTVGEIWVRGICLFCGYYKDPAPPLTGPPDAGWFRTGDLGAVDAQGRLSFKGRIKDMLKVGGENVSAAEVEAYLLRHPAIAVAQVVAAPDLRLGEIPAAFVEIKPGSDLSAEQVIAYCRQGMAGFKVPRIVRFVTDWPTSSTKIQKHRLREFLAISQSTADNQMPVG